MRNTSILASLALPGLLFTLACKRPEVEAFKAKPLPVVVVFAAPASIPEKEQVEREYAAALRARLATRVTVVEEGVKPPPAYAELKVTITDYTPGSRGPTPGKVGIVTGVSVGAFGALAGNRHAVFDGFFWGLMAGGMASNAREREHFLGYTPNRVRAQVAMQQAGLEEPLETFAVYPSEVIDAMDPLRGEDRDDEARIREEEAKALARVVITKLQDAFGWLPRSTPSWYGPDRGETPAPPPQP